MKCTNTAVGAVFRDDVFTVTIDLKYDGDYSSGNTAPSGSDRDIKQEDCDAICLI